jgi:hypothetical protein
VWRDEPSGTDVVATYETSYGTVKQVFVLPNGHAMVAAWDGDNSGPGDASTIQSFYAYLHQRFPGASVQATSFDEFFAVANTPEIKAQLPVITQEIGDGWLDGGPGGC